MILSDPGILPRLAEDDLMVDPVGNVDTQVQPMGVGPRPGTEFLKFQRTSISCIHPDRESEVSEYVHGTHAPKDDGFILHPGDFVLGTTKEHVETPIDLLATIEGHSSLSHSAVVTHVTAGTVDSGYEGQITLELPNLGTTSVALTPSMRISQPVLAEMKLPTGRPYGVEHDSKYQGQRGPQVSRLSSDPEPGGDE